MRLRKLDAALDMQFGHSANDFFVDDPAGCAQLAVSRLNLDGGEYWLDQSDGMFWSPYVIGRGTEFTRDPVIKARILGTYGVTGIFNYSSALDRETRGFSVNTGVYTKYSTSILGAILMAGG